MKVNDLTEIRDAIADCLMERGCELVNLIGAQNTIMCVLCIYVNNDQTRGYGQDFSYKEDPNDDIHPVQVSVITSPVRLSIITNDGMSYYKDNIPLVGYEDLSEDVYHILMVIDTVLDRIAAQK